MTVPYTCAVYFIIYRHHSFMASSLRMNFLGLLPFIICGTASTTLITKDYYHWINFKTQINTINFKTQLNTICTNVYAVKLLISYSIKANYCQIITPIITSELVTFEMWIQLCEILCHWCKKVFTPHSDFKILMFLQMLG